MSTAALSQRRSGWLSRAIVSGFVASSVMLFAFLVAYLFADWLSTIEISNWPWGAALRTWFYNLAHNSFTNLAAGNLYAAVGLFLIGGVLWAIIYAGWAEPRLAGPAWMRGAVYALLPGILSQLIVMPLVGGGPAGAALGAGPLPAFGALLLHLVYGIILGVVYSPLGDIDATTFQQFPSADVEATLMARTERTTAVGVVAGALAGVVFGVLAILLGVFSGDAHPAAIILGGVLLASALGGLVGSFAGLTPANKRRAPR
jgi:hypothetical protein